MRTARPDKRRRTKSDLQYVVDISGCAGIEGESALPSACAGRGVMRPPECLALTWGSRLNQYMCYAICVRRWSQQSGLQSCFAALANLSACILPPVGLHLSTAAREKLRCILLKDAKLARKTTTPYRNHGCFLDSNLPLHLTLQLRWQTRDSKLQTNSRPNLWPNFLIVPDILPV